MELLNNLLNIFIPLSSLTLQDNEANVNNIGIKVPLQMRVNVWIVHYMLKSKIDEFLSSFDCSKWSLWRAFSLSLSLVHNELWILLCLLKTFTFYEFSEFSYKLKTSLIYYNYQQKKSISDFICNNSTLPPQILRHTRRMCDPDGFSTEWLDSQQIFDC